MLREILCWLGKHEYTTGQAENDWFYRYCRYCLKTPSGNRLSLLTLISIKVREAKKEMVYQIQKDIFKRGG